MNSHLLSDLAKGHYIQDWLILGPFVVKTGDHFEREYMYERERILDIDYLAEDGGEASVAPELGRSHGNIGLGPKRLAWFEYHGPRILGDDLAGDIIYETVQRNCVFYAAAAIEAEANCTALLDAYHSGMKAWVNGELACNMPYGLPKGVRTTMPPAPIRLRKGPNLLLLKFRPGYICDGIDFNVSRVGISPLASYGNLPISMGRVRATPYFRGTPERPEQVIEAALLNTSSVANSIRVTLASETLGAETTQEVLCEPQRVTVARLSLPMARKMAGTAVRAVLRARMYGETIEVPFEYTAAEPPKYDGKVFVLSSFHFDTTYHEEQRVYAMGAFDIVRQYCRLHRADPLFRSIISEVDYLKPYFDVYPEERETLLQIFRGRRSEPDVMYNQPNEQNCGDEALVRNFLYGQLIHGRVFGNICHVYGPGDVFGHPNQLSQIARKSGCIGITWDKQIFNFPPFFEHLSLDGSSLPHKRGQATEDDVHAMGLPIRTGWIDQTPPTSWHATLMPAYQQGTYRDLISAIQIECRESGARLPVTSRDMSLYHAATAISRTDLKVANRLGENLLLDAEKFATLANLLGAKYPERALDKAWRQILCGQHHDSITGTHNEISFVDLMNSYREVLELGTEVLDGALDFIGKAVDAKPPKDAQPHLVFNPLAWSRTDVTRLSVNLPKNAQNIEVRDPKGRRVPFEVTKVVRDKKGGIEKLDILFVVKDTPSLGYRSYYVCPAKGKLPEAKTTTGKIIENEFYRVETDPERGGGLTSIFDKETKREVLDSSRHVGNELAFLEEVAHRNETQHEFYTTGLKMFSGDQPARVEVVAGPISMTLRARYSMGELCDVVQETTLYKGIKRIEFRTILLDVQRENYLYCVTFPTKLKGLSPVFDERFGAVVRNDSKGFLDFRTHQMLMFSDCAVYAANKWMEYGNSATLRLGRNAYGISMVGLIAPDDTATQEIAETIQRTLVKKGVTCTPWYSGGGPHWGSYREHMDDDLLYTRFRISIGIKGSNAYSKTLLDAQAPKVRKNFEQRLSKKEFAFLFVKDANLKDPSWPALPVLIVEATSHKSLATAIEQLLAEYPDTAGISLPADVNATGESHTVDNYGVALLNRGTYANSIEKGGVLCTILGHTCRWYGGTNNFPEGYLIPENKDHAYTYALYPHAGNWREAKTHRAGYEYNHPLIARPCAPMSRPFLPSEDSFLRVAPDNLIVTAMKPVGNPIASFEKLKTSDALNGITLRLYDPTGTDTAGCIAFGNGIQEAWKTNLLEERQQSLHIKKGEIPLDVPAFSIETVEIRPNELGKRMPTGFIGPEAEPVQPVWVRSWEHDAESMPMGYGAVVCSISREVEEEDEGRTLRLKVNVVNDYTDTAVSGEARVIVPDGWSAEPSVVRFDVPPLGHVIAPLTVRRTDAAHAGQIKLRYEYDGQVFQDVLEIGGAFNIDMSAENRGNAIVVTLHNPTAEHLDAELSMVAPIETWPERLTGSLTLREISPRTVGISLKPKMTETVTFEVAQKAETPTRQDSYWAVAKLMSNGRIQLKRCDNRPAERRMWSEKWFRLRGLERE